MKEPTVEARKAGVDSRNLKRYKDEQQVRQRPAPTFGTNDELGAYHGIWEIIMNSIDEAREGFGKLIEVEVKPNNVIVVSDDGRGLPMGWNEAEDMYNWELSLCSLYASGKYDSTQYGSAVGLNGLGLTAMQYASSYMKVWSTYDDRTYHMEFKQGRPVTELEVLEPIRKGSGTRIEFQPDPEVFPALEDPTVKIEATKYFEDLRRQAMLVPGLTIKFTHYELAGGEPINIVFDNGIVDSIDMMMDIIQMKPIIGKTIYFEGETQGTDRPQDEDYTLKMKFAMNFGRRTDGKEWSSVAEHVEFYHNGSYLFEGGVTAQAFKLGILTAISVYGLNEKKLKKSDSMTFEDVADLMVAVVATDCPGYRSWFKNQTKGAINNPFIGQALKAFVTDKVLFWLNANKAEADKLLNECVANMKARLEAKAVSKKVINSLSKTVSFSNKPAMFRDCSSKVVEKRELYIVEGRSALGSTKLACDPRFQAVLPLKGKTINCLKNSLAEVLNSEIIIDLYRVLGCGIEAKSKHINDLPKFDINKLNWGKIIICTDADVDGYHIRCLVLTALMVLSPSLIKEGKVYVAETPLYELKVKVPNRGETSVFAYTDEERDTYIQKLVAGGIPEKNIDVSRSKGLGENDAEMMNKTTMDPENRHLIKISYPESDDQLIKTMQSLLGDDLSGRKELIFDYFDNTDEPALMDD